MNPKTQRALVIALIVLGVVTVGFFGLRTLRAIKEFRGHRPPPPFGPADAQQEAATDVELIRDWMTIPYIARMYQVPPPMLFDAIGIHHKGNEEKSLKQLNDEFFPAEDGVVLEKVKAAILAIQPPPTPTVPPVPTAPSVP